MKSLTISTIALLLICQSLTQIPSKCKDQQNCYKCGKRSNTNLQQQPMKPNECVQCKESLVNTDGTCLDMDISSTNCRVFDFNSKCIQCKPGFATPKNNPEVNYCAPILIKRCFSAEFSDLYALKPKCKACLGGYPTTDFTKCGTEFTPSLKDDGLGQQPPTQLCVLGGRRENSQTFCAYCTSGFVSKDGVCTQATGNLVGCRIAEGGTCVECDESYYMGEPGKCVNM